MDTKVIKIDSNNPDISLIKMAANIILEGELVGFPTETVYGLGANGLNEEAVKKIFKAKGRPQDNPLILHVDSIDMVKELVEEIPENAIKCMEKFWPGPLTILFKRSHIVPDIITAGLDTVAIRMPDHKIALELIKESKKPIAAPSANSSGKPSPTRSDHVIEDMWGKIPLIIDGGSTGVGLESTVLDLTEEIPMILRPGGISQESIKEVLGNCIIDPGLDSNNDEFKPRSPGQKYRHYAPKAELIVYSGDIEIINHEMIERAKKEEHNGLKVGIMTTTEYEEIFSQWTTQIMGSSSDMESIAHNLFHSLRELDEKKVDIILCQGVKMDRLGFAIMNRLKKASGGNIIHV